MFANDLVLCEELEVNLNQKVMIAAFGEVSTRTVEKMNKNKSKVMALGREKGSLREASVYEKQDCLRKDGG